MSPSAINSQLILISSKDLLQNFGNFLSAKLDISIFYGTVFSVITLTFFTGKTMFLSLLLFLFTLIAILVAILVVPFLRRHLISRFVLKFYNKILPPISQTERVRLAEEAVLKTVAPAMVSKVRVLGAPPIPPPAWCNSSTLGSQPGNPGALPGAGATSSFAR